MKFLKNHTIHIITLIFILHGNSNAREAKEYDNDVNYEETKIPHYDLPQLLIGPDGKKISSTSEWEEIRRPQILSLYSNLIYGRVPEPVTPLKISFKLIKEDRDFMKGKATRKDIDIVISNSKGSKKMRFLVFSPNEVDGPAPAFLKHSFNNTKSDDFDASKFRPGKLKNGWPLGEFFDRGYGFCAVYHEDLVGHNEVGFNNSIHKLFFPKGQSFPKASEWGVISACAWGAMRAMDYLETDNDIDHEKVAIMGHSKMGKTTLWTAAQDERFALAIAAQSGCAGAALWRRKSGETLKKMVTRFPYWLCRNAWKFIDQEDDLPIDQHMLLACIAPRPIYVHSGVKDTWADGRGEYLSAFYASEVYKLYGEKALDSQDSPQAGKAIIESHVGYHIREGGHSIESFDWKRFLDFADYHLK